MHFRAAVAAAILLAAASQSVFGVEYTLLGGDQRCGEWTRLRTLGDKGVVTEVAKLRLFERWVDGFISGINVAGVETGQPDYLASRPEPSAMYAVVDNYCRVNPLDKVRDGGIALVQELRTRAAAARRY